MFLKKWIMSPAAAIVCMASIASCDDSYDPDSESIYGDCEISGTVYDIDSATVAGASVTIFNVEDVCMPLTVKTDRNGRYSVRNKRATALLLMEVSSDNYDTFHQIMDIEYRDGVPHETLGWSRITSDVVIVPSKHLPQAVTGEGL